MSDETTQTSPTEPEEGADFAIAPGATIGPYRLLGELGRGGMGVVYRALDPRLNREVALKIMHAHRATDPVATARFLQEARAAAALTHDHVTPVYSTGKHEGRPYLVMPLLRGESLAKCLKREGRLPAAEALRVHVRLTDPIRGVWTHPR